eukprot:Gb_01795 [translate_table: standard]
MARRVMREICARNSTLNGDSPFPVHRGCLGFSQYTHPSKNPGRTTSHSSSGPQNTPSIRGFAEPFAHRTVKDSGKMQISHVERGMNGSFLAYDRRFFSNESKSLDYSQEVDEINVKFAEAREEIDMALESKETVYFDEEAESARAAVKQTLEMFEALLAKLPEAERGVVQRSMGLKMEQLKAELKQVNE